MKKLNYLLLVTGVLVFSSCSGDLEERVRDLEGRVIALETQLNGGAKPQPVNRQNVNTAGIQNKTITITANTYPSSNKLQIKANVLKAAGDTK